MIIKEIIRGDYKVKKDGKYVGIRPNGADYYWVVERGGKFYFHPSDWSEYELIKYTWKDLLSI